MQDPVVGQLDKALLQYASSIGDRFSYSLYFKPVTLEPLPADTDAASRIDVIKQLLSSEFGYLFYDRTRIRPKTFTIGEHIFALSLAPGEEVVIEHKTFSKRETTFEDQTEREEQTDLELSSTLSTELSEGLDRERNTSDQTSFGVSGGASAPLGPVNVHADASYSRNIGEANSVSRRRSVKDSSAASQKVASKYRAAHKTTFRIATEDRFESTSKRVLKNPNKYSSLDLHYFKVMRQFELTNERYASRLCWAVPIADPAAEVLERIAEHRQTARASATAKVMAELAAKPIPPPIDTKPPLVRESAATAANVWAINGGMSYDYDIGIPIPAGYHWNGDLDEMSALSSAWGRPSNAMWWELRGSPWVDEGQLFVKMHIGAKGWIGGPPITMQTKARFVPDPPENDPEYLKKLEAWRADVARWETERESKLQGPLQKADDESDAWEQTLRTQLNPVAELMHQIANSRFLPNMSDEEWEVDFWGQVFDWRTAGVTLFPGWWAKRPPRDELQTPDSFFNASWAKLYLPVRPGFERLALRWIVGHVEGDELDPKLEARFAEIAKDLTTFRTESFGDAVETPIDGTTLQEKFITLGHWTELLPTDGTHIEVVQGMTSAIDDSSRIELDDLRRERSARAADDEQDVALKKRALERIGADNKPSVAVIVSTGPGETNGRT